MPVRRRRTFSDLSHPTCKRRRGLTRESYGWSFPLGKHRDQEGCADKVKGKLFGKLSRAVIVAAQHGGADPASNLPLRYAIDKARKASMPKDNIERAIKKGCGGTDESYTEVVYEGYGPGGVAVLCDILTENRNRTAGEIRKIFEVGGGRLGSVGCVAWMFERKGVFLVPAKHVDENTLYSAAIDAGADDVKLSGESYEVLSCPSRFTKLPTLSRRPKSRSRSGNFSEFPPAPSISTRTTAGGC